MPGFSKFRKTIEKRREKTPGVLEGERMAEGPI
jgi:hypothetical protein